MRAFKDLFRLMLAPLFLGCLFLLAPVGMANFAKAAEIEGVTDGSSEDAERQRRRAELIGVLTGSDPKRTIIHFTILPSLDDPTVYETRVYVQRRGDQEVCVALTAPDIISRGYTPEDGVIFEPEVPATIVLKESNETGELIGYNESKLFIRPHSPTYEFDTDECFTVGDFEGCLVEGDLACDEILEENQEVCIGQNGITAICSRGLDHAQSVDDLLKLIATNALAPPVITEAGPAQPGLPGDFGPGDIFQAPEVGSPTSPLPPISSPTVSDVVPLVGGGGTDPNLVLVPDVAGQTVQEATETIEAATLFVSDVVIEEDLTPIIVGGLSIIGTAHAQIIEPGICVSGLSTRTDPPKDTEVFENTGVMLFVCPTAADVPEPASILIFVTGLLLLVIAFKCRNFIRSQSN